MHVATLAIMVSSALAFGDSKPTLALHSGNLGRTGVTSATAPGEPKGLKWETYVGNSRILPLSLAEGKLWVAQDGQALIQGLDPSSGKSVFQYKAEQNLVSAPLCASGILYFGTKRFGLAGGSAKFFGVDIQTQKIKLKDNYSFMVEIPTPVIYRDWLYRVGSNFLGNTQTILSNKSGGEVWSEQIGPLMPSIPATDGTRIFYVLHQKWGSGPTGAFYNLNQTSTWLSAQDVDTGSIQWVFAAKSRFMFPVIFHKNVLIGTQDSLVALEQEKGSVTWKFEEKGGNFTPPAISENIAVVGTQSGWVYGVNVEIAKLLWKIKVDGEVPNQPTIAGLTAFIPVAMPGGSGMVLALDIQTGKEIWRLKCDSPATSILVNSDGIIFGTSSGKVVAYQ
ncbi:MAG: PQQ-binding-like beta-propeller repeat protein [Holophagaceae bacterium]|nr:PQQ-binding-like beta-propeller repeat protein [Holophagaceae bacterium]